MSAPIPKNAVEEALAAYTKLVRSICEAGRRTIGPTLTAAVLEFAAKALEKRARLDGAWNPEDSVLFRSAAQDGLDELGVRWEQRRSDKAQGKPS